jgi:cullin-associated NEDD8-dissociated protein 1
LLFIYANIKKERLSSPSIQLRAAVATAIKYAVVDPSGEHDPFLKPIIKKFLQLLEDSDLVKGYIIQ